MAGHGVATKAAKIRKYVQDQLGIDAGKLSDEDVKKVAIFILQATSLETPMVAEHRATKLGLKVWGNR